MIKAYVRARRGMLLLFAAMPCFLLLNAWLWHMDFTPVLYTIVLYLALAMLYVMVDGARYTQRLAWLRQINRSLSLDAQSLPSPAGAVEETYQQMVTKLYQMAEERSSTLLATHEGQVAYYTLWMHQIKTPIAAMRLMLETDDARSRALSQELFRVERYVEMALQYIKLPGLASDLVLEEVAVDEVVRRCAKKYAELFILKRLSFTLRDTHMVVPSDVKWLAFLIEQVLSNAIKYTDRGGVTIEGEGDTLRIIDTGAGIRKEDLPRVFEQGYTGYNGRIDLRASGLGLYMASQVAQALSIGLAITSEPGKGTQVSLTFPKEDFLTRQ